MLVPHRVVIASDRIEHYYQYVEQMLSIVLVMSANVVQKHLENIVLA